MLVIIQKFREIPPSSDGSEVTELAQAGVKASFPLIEYAGILKSIIHLFLAFLLFFPSLSKHKEFPHKVLTDVTN